MKRDTKVPTNSEETWSLTGRVVDNDGRPVKGVTVRLYDKDLKFDESLGTSQTDKDGYFYIKHPIKRKPKKTHSRKQR